MKRPRNGRAGGILKLAADDPERELEFELAYLRSLTTQERFALMFRKSRELAESLAHMDTESPLESLLCGALDRRHAKRKRTVRGESDEGRRPAPLGRGPGGGPSACIASGASARAFPTNGAARRAV